MLKKVNLKKASDKEIFSSLPARFLRPILKNPFIVLHVVSFSLSSKFFLLDCSQGSLFETLLKFFCNDKKMTEKVDRI